MGTTLRTTRRDAPQRQEPDSASDSDLFCCLQRTNGVFYALYYQLKNEPALKKSIFKSKTTNFDRDDLTDCDKFYLDQQTADRTIVDDGDKSVNDKDYQSYEDLMDERFLDSQK